MHLNLTVVDPARGEAVDVLLDADGDAPIGAVHARLRSLLGRPAADAGSERGRLYAAGLALDPDQSLRESPLREAALLGLDVPVGSPDAEPEGLIELRVAGGPGAGRVHRLDLGEHDAGAAAGCAVRLADPTLPERALRLRVLADGRCLVRPLPGASAQLDRADLDGEREWPPAAQVALGRTLLQLALPAPPDAALQPSEDGGGLDYNRPPRLSPPQRRTRFHLPTPPGERERQPLPLLAALAPLLLAVGGVYVFHSYYFLLFAALSPVTIVASFVSDRRRGRASARRQRAEYAERRARIEAEAGAALRQEEADRRAGCPDPAEVLLTAVGPRRRLWERRRRDGDFLVVRVGTADQASGVVLQDDTRDEHRRQFARDAADVPVAVPLTDHGVLGIAGSPEAVAAAGRWIVAQAAVLHSPADLQICLLTGAGGERTWDWVRWLPHLRPPAGLDTLALVGSDADSIGRRVAELTALVAARAAAAGAPRGPVSGEPSFLVVLDGARRLRSLPGVVQILRDGPAAGVYAVCLDAEERLLPEECQAVVVEEAGLLRVQREGTAAVTGVRPDGVDLPWCRVVARALGPIRDVGGDEEASGLPASCRLLDLLDLDTPDPDAIAARWLLGGRSTRAVVGVSIDGPMAIDLVRDGPHGLVAGTTGAGKSELLQTLVASLAVANRPDAMNFVLVDYKGGSAFKDCVHLPHTVGMVTDLDAHLVERALRSLSAELRRRERVLAAAGVKDAEDYVALLGREPERPPLPRLLIVIDEFASLARELPDFITGLVNIAQRGRSLGIHLILATQRPAGVVSAEIRANTNLRIAMRMTDAAESRDVLDAPDAARIGRSTPGRAYVRLGPASLLPFQAARVGGPRRDPRRHEVAEPWATEIVWSDLGRPAPERPGRTQADEAGETDLSAVVAAVRAAAERLGVAAQPAPWLAPLPAALVLDDLPAPGPAAGAALPPVPYGLADLPAEQAQRPVVVDLATLGHLHVIGSPRGGRSQTLRTIAGALARAHSCADLHLYGIDCGNGALHALADLPHCGAVVGHTEVERLVRLLARLLGELTRRQALLAAHGVADLTELRATSAPNERPPHVVLLVDRWEVFDRAFGEYDGGSLVEAVLRLFREGAGAGLHVVAAGDRVLLSTRFSPATDDKLVLRLNDRADYGMAGIPTRQVPGELPSGRALRVADGAEVQVALLAPDASGAGQGAALRRIAGEAAARDAGVGAWGRPFRVDQLPDRLTFAEAWAYPRSEQAALWAMVGVGGDELAAMGADLASAPTFVVAGPTRSGRSTVLLTMARSLLAGGARLTIVAPRTSPLRDLEGEAGVVRVHRDPELAPEDLRTTLAEMGRPGVVLIDDAELLKDTRAGADLSQLARAAAGPGLGLVLAGEADVLNAAFVTWIAEARHNRRGALLSPQGLADGDLIGVRVPRSLLGGAVEPGRALVHFGDGRLVTLRVPS